MAPLRLADNIFFTQRHLLVASNFRSDAILKTCQADRNVHPYFMKFIIYSIPKQRTSRFSLCKD